MTVERETSKDKDDPLLRALRELPTQRDESDTSRRAKAIARAAFVRSFDDEPWHTRVFGTASRAAVPVVLAGVVGIYLMWAVAAANALFK
jgi:hypothetical protein